MERFTFCKKYNAVTTKEQPVTRHTVFFGIFFGRVLRALISPYDDLERVQKRTLSVISLLEILSSR